jgi:2-aminoethylphosphonate-pyruvate transaminase
MIRTAVILAAGMGTRLRDEVENIPKGFLRLGQQPIIEESIERLVAAGIRDIVIVTGHCADHYDRLAAGQDGLVRTVHNPRFADSGSMYSLYCARDVIDDESFLLLESDLIYEPRALTELLVEPAADAILLSGPTGAGDEVWVETRDDNLVAMTKDREELTGYVAGELVGISKISAELFTLMQEIADRAFEMSLRYDYETDCLVAAGARRSIRCPLVPDLVWAEIDDPGHLHRAREQIYPRIVQVD